MTDDATMITTRLGPATTSVHSPADGAASGDSAAGARAEAREVYRQSLDAELPLTGRALGEMFGRSDRWGRERISEVRAEQATDSAGVVPEGGMSPIPVPETGIPLLASRSASTVPPQPAGPSDGPVMVPPAAGLVAAMPVPASSAALTDAGGIGGGQPPGARAMVWTAFLLGIAASLAANVAHASAGMGPRLAAGFVPLALLLAVECMTRPVWNRDGFLWGLTRYGATGLVAAVAAVMSYRHMHGLLLSYGEDSLTAALGPLAIDGLMTVAGFALLATTPTHTRKDSFR